MEAPGGTLVDAATLEEGLDGNSVGEQEMSPGSGVGDSHPRHSLKKD